MCEKVSRFYLLAGGCGLRGLPSWRGMSSAAQHHGHAGRCSSMVGAEWILPEHCFPLQHTHTAHSTTACPERETHLWYANNGITGQYSDQIKYLMSAEQFNTEFTHSGRRPTLSCQFIGYTFLKLIQSNTNPLQKSVIKILIIFFTETVTVSMSSDSLKSTSAPCK